VRKLTADIVTTVQPTGVVSFACPPPVVGISALLPVPTVAVADVPQRTTAGLRPSSRQWAALGRITAEGVGYAGSDLVSGARGAERRQAAAPAAAAQRTISTARNARFTQNKQLHLMSRRDPCSWRPPV